MSWKVYRDAGTVGPCSIFGAFSSLLSSCLARSTLAHHSGHGAVHVLADGTSAGVVLGATNTSTISCCACRPLSGRWLLKHRVHMCR
eukprot:7907528-Pyramimonas_sp.AAC.1